MASDPDFMASLARGLTVLRAFSQQRPNQSISQLSVRTEIPRAAVRRCLHTLERLGYVGRDVESRTFMLRPKVLSLGYSYLSSVPLVTLAQPALDKLSEALHESASMAVLEAGEIVYVARSRSHAPAHVGGPHGGKPASRLLHVAGRASSSRTSRPKSSRATSRRSSRFGTRRAP